MVVYVSKLCYISYPLISKLQDSKLKIYLVSMVGRDISVGIATDYRLDGPGIKFLWGRDFPQLSIPALGPIQPPVQLVPGVKQLGRDIDHPPTSSAEIKGREQLYLCFLSGPSWPVLGYNLTFCLYLNNS